MHPLDDTRVIHQHGPHTVLAQCYNVAFRDGTSVGLHPVVRAGVREVFLRAVRVEGLQWLVFDLRHLSAAIEDDILQLQPRDTPGVVLYTLRGLYPSAKAFHAAVAHRWVAQWWHADTAPLFAEAA
jgi:hypothetical protein